MDTQTADFARAAAPHTEALLLEKVTSPSLTQLESLAADLRKYPILNVARFAAHIYETGDRGKQFL